MYLKFNNILIFVLDEGPIIPNMKYKVIKINIVFQI